VNLKRKSQISIAVNKTEKQLIQTNAKLHKYHSVSGFLRDRGLETDISNKASLAIILSYLSSHMKDISQDGALNWITRKKNIKQKHLVELADMKPEQRQKYMEKLETVLNHNKAIQKELEEILSARFIEE